MSRHHVLPATPVAGVLMASMMMMATHPTVLAASSSSSSRASFIRPLPTNTNTEPLVPLPPAGKVRCGFVLEPSQGSSSWALWATTPGVRDLDGGKKRASKGMRPPGGGGTSPDTSQPVPQQPHDDAQLADLIAELAEEGVSDVRFVDQNEYEEVIVREAGARRAMDCLVDLCATINGTRFMVAAPVFDPVALCYHKGGKMIPVDNDSELMDRLYDFLAPAFEKEDLFLHRSPVCLTLDGDLGQVDEEGDEDDLDGWEEYDSEDDDDFWVDDDEDGEVVDRWDPEEFKKKTGMDVEVATKDEREKIKKETNPLFWDDANSVTVEDAYGKNWERVAAFTYDDVKYSMVKILEPVLILAKAGQPFGKNKNIPNWLLASESEAERIAPIMEELITAKLGVTDDEEEEEEE